jgi:hypothetical protein
MFRAWPIGSYSGDGNDSPVDEQVGEVLRLGFGPNDCIMYFTASRA